MRFIKTTLLAPALLFLLAAGAQEQTLRFPFQLTAQNNLSVPVLINGADSLFLMFHLAADAVTLTAETTRKIHSVRFETTDSVSSWGGTGNASRFSSNNRLQIGDHTWEHLPVWEDQYSGKGTDGKFGPHLFNKKAVRIDFDKKQITIDDRFPVDGYKKFKLIHKSGMLFIEAGLRMGGKTYLNQYLLHTGYSGDLLLDDAFVMENHLNKTLKVTETKALKDAFGNIVKVQKAVAPQLTIGPFRFNNVPVGFFEGKLGAQQMSFMGGDLLKRFNLIIDAERQFIYLKPNTLQHTVFFKG
ncbi:aspartyl protease family protein [Niabella pedocola]|uniref:Aspartyl protease family protein n=1 Tax=Niabella pedocola TaxID=1752077 RepID=A0ABS8PQA7_9BACT|nr:aspartyl protease family protein [Niabella pedocola]MCD2423288.1 aspartyl protease family protein [Niabella pedocola]